MGHEYSGTVEGVGENVTAFEVGDKVVEEPIHHCGCFQCRNGESNVCDNFSITGMHRGGASADYIVVKPKHLHTVPADIPLREAAITEPTSIATKAVLIQSAVTPGDDVLVSGLEQDATSRLPQVEQLGIDTVNVESTNLDALM